ncbi:carbamate kinase [Eubacterium aggregans]|uniref:Carbamate kinase n=1 Tax=Eubacterium aggregans TaxID=81409 RepID=A0A1H4CEA7_9FIRM|nr:carbamate kinase [Eubacterium aggregans]MDD4692762.1 carbamate kinase [Eubacterium aggregans]SEA58737.1 carbamate kinase [Eubacterium aggregans]
MGKKIVIALGGNALGNNLPEQMAAVKETAKAIVDLIEEGNEVVISHGNGPQVGMINLAMGELAKVDPGNPVAPLSVCVAMSQGYIGYDLQNAIREELLDRGIQKPVSSIITQMRVDPEDAAFQNPTKPIGRFMTKEEADQMVKERGYDIMEDAGRGYRRVVASPRPVEIVEIETVRALIDAGQVVIAAGGGGIPVYAQGNHLKGAAAVVDKDFGSCLLAKDIDADCLIILTAVEKVAINFGKENQENLSEISVEQAVAYANEGQFAPGSMLPKVQAAMDFASSKEDRFALITLLEKAKDGIQGKTGTIIK